MYIDINNLWNSSKKEKAERINSVTHITNNKIIPADRIIEFLENIIKPADTVILEGDNQKQASFLSESLARLNPEKVNNLHMVMANISRSEHLDLFENKIASVIDFAYAGNQSKRLADMVEKKKINIGSINTYLELYARLFVDLIPDICLIAADKSDGEGNLYTGSNTEDTPTYAEAAGFKDGIIIAQVNAIVDKVDRVDIPGDWVDFIVETGEPYGIEPIFTKDPAKITNEQILMAMMAIKGIYSKHKVKTLNHGIGYNTAAIELLLPTFGESLNLKGQICVNWVLNPHPTLIPAIESGWVSSICAFGGEIGMEKYIEKRPDIFFTGRDGTLRSNRAIAQMAGLYGIDMFVGSTLQMDYSGNSSTVTKNRITGFGGAPNMGHNPDGRRHATETWMSMKDKDDDFMTKGRKLVVQILSTKNKNGESNFVEKLDAVEVGKKANMPIAPIMIYGEDITHVVTEKGIAYLYKARDLHLRKKLLAAVAGETEHGKSISIDEILQYRKNGMIAYPEDLKINPHDANKSLLSAKSFQELVDWSHGLYQVPKKFY